MTRADARPADRPGALDGRAARRRAPRARARLRGRRHRVDRRAPADDARLQPRRRRRARRRPRRDPLAAGASATSPGSRWPRSRSSLDIADGPERVLACGPRALRASCCAAPGARASEVRGDRRRRPGPGRVRDRPAGQPADHARLGRLLDPALVRRPLRRAGARRQRRQHHGPAASTGPTGATASTCSTSRSAPASAAGSSPTATSTAARRARPATSATSAWPTTTTSICRCGNVGCLEAVAGGRALAQRLAAEGRDARRQPRRRRARAGGRPAGASAWSARPAARSARCSPAA